MSVFTSGNWLMTAKRRAKEGILQAVGAHQATEDLEFDQRLKNFNTHVNELNKIKEAMELWIESFDTFCTASLILGESFKNFFAQTPFRNEEASPNISAYANVSAAFDKVMLDINQTVQPAIRETFVNRCLKPTISILSLVPAINEQVQERKTIMLDFDSYKAKIQKEHAAGRDSAHPNVAKKAMKLDDSAKKLYAIQQSIVSSIEEYEAARPIMLGAEFASFIACYYQQSYYASDLTSKLLPIVPQSSSSLNMMDLYIMQHNKQKQALNLVGDSGHTTRVLSGGYAPPNNSFMSTQFLCELKARNACPIVDPVLTRTEYLGGSYGGYNTGGQYLRPTSATEDDDDIREATAQLVSPTGNSTSGGLKGGAEQPSSSSGGISGGTTEAVSEGNAANQADSHLSVNTPVVDAVVIEGECTEATSPASLVSVHDSTSSSSTPPAVAASKPPPPPKAPKIMTPKPSAVELHVNTTEVAADATVTESSGAFVTAVDGANLENAADESTGLDNSSDAGFYTPSVGPRGFAFSNAPYPTPLDVEPAVVDSEGGGGVALEQIYGRPTSVFASTSSASGSGPPKPPRVPATPAPAPPAPVANHSTNPFDED